MSAEPAALVRTWKVGPYLCTLSAPRPTGRACQSIVIEWDPTPPARSLTRDEMRQYRDGRDRAIADLLAEIGGGNALVVET